ncbi:MFS transporter [Streptomyces sp. NPDC005969]|uniref:MFS transporter n=1 Tax=Streptomyces sp. NPDC005969 TaxID=3156722 RepID=UPI0033E8E4E2
MGNGLFITAAILYFTFVVHLPATQVGAGFTIAGLSGLAAGIPAGNLADRYGPRAIWLVALALQAVTMAAFVFINSWLAFTLVATLDRLAATASGAAGGALIARVGGERPAAFRARLQTFVNLGVVVGTLGAAVAIQINTRCLHRADPGERRKLRLRRTDRVPGRPELPSSAPAQAAPSVVRAGRPAVCVLRRALQCHGAAVPDALVAMSRDGSDSVKEVSELAQV